MDPKNDSRRASALEGERFRALYFSSRITLSWFLLVCFLFAYPASLVVGLWLPAYADALKFLPLILPLCLFGSSVSLLTGTYLKVIRREQDFLVGNCIALLISLVLLLISIVFLKNLTFAVLSMPIGLAFRSWILEKRLSKQLAVNAIPVFVTELIASAVFISASVFIGGYAGALCYGAFLCIAFIVCRKSFWRTPLPFWNRNSQ